VSDRGSGDIRLRIGNPADVEQLIDLMLVASWRGMEAAWVRDARVGQPWRDVARAALRDPEGEFSAARCLVATAGDDGLVLGMALVNTFRERLKPETGGTEETRAVVGLINHALPGLIIRELGVRADSRGQGVATRLLERAGQLAAHAGLGRVALTVNSENTAARALYLKLHFADVAEIEGPPHPHWSAASRLLLMAKAVQG
jgi:GNAT superfamily N-acetyltransferase